MPEAATGGVLKRGCSKKFWKIHRETPVTVSLFYCNFIKKENLAQAFSCEFCKISMNAFYTEHLRATPPEIP